MRQNDLVQLNKLNRDKIIRKLVKLFLLGNKNSKTETKICWELKFIGKIEK